MKTRIRFWPLPLLVSLAGLSCAPPADLFELRCDAEGVGVTVSGTVLAGKGITTPPTAVRVSGVNPSVKQQQPEWQLDVESASISCDLHP